MHNMSLIYCIIFTATVAVCTRYVMYSISKNVRTRTCIFSRDCNLNSLALKQEIEKIFLQ